jgi:hypothetical protein
VHRSVGVFWTTRRRAATSAAPFNAVSRPDIAANNVDKAGRSPPRIVHPDHAQNAQIIVSDE